MSLIARLASAVLLVGCGCGRVAFDPHDDARLGSVDAVPQTYREVVLADHPVRYWRMADLAKPLHDEITGVDGTYVGTCTRGVPGALALDPDPAVRFDGATCEGHVQAPVFLGVAPYAIELWVHQADARLTIFLMNETRTGPDPDSGYGLIGSGLGEAYTERAVSANNDFTPFTRIAHDRYVHLVGSYDGALLTLFIDGVAATSAPDPRAMPAYSATTYLGASPTGGIFLQGELDEIALYDHALSAAQVARHHDVGVRGPSPP